MININELQLFYKCITLKQHIFLTIANSLYCNKLSVLLLLCAAKLTTIHYLNSLDQEQIPGHSASTFFHISVV
jgi:hypothetical protein